jgi:hypothetical protein
MAIGNWKLAGTVSGQLSASGCQMSVCGHPKATSHLPIANCQLPSADHHFLIEGKVIKMNGLPLDRPTAGLIF